MYTIFFTDVIFLIKRLTGILLCAVMVLSAAVYPQSDISITASANAEDGIVMLTESDLSYKLLPVNAPTYAVVQKYSGNLTKIEIPSSLEGYPVKSLSGNVFSDAENITYIKLPSTVATITYTAFNNADTLTYIDVDSENSIFTSVDGVLYKKDSATGELTSLVRYPQGKGGSFIVPKSVTLIEKHAFYFCYHLTDVKMYNNVLKIDDGAFAYCWNMSSIKLSDNLRSLGAKALAHCPKLKKLTLPATLQVIGSDAILGYIESTVKASKVYYFSQGISCTPDTYAYKYVLAQHLPEEIIVKTRRTITDIDTGIFIVDANDILPVDKNLDITVDKLDTAEFGQLPIRYSSASAYNINITSDGENYTPKGNFVIYFDGDMPGAVPSATKVYAEMNGRLLNVNGSPNTPFVGCSVSQGGRFLVLSNNDFSLQGDIDGDGVVTLYDAKAALHVSVDTLTLTEEQFTAADTDNNGDITVTDARNILRRAAGIIK